MVFSLSETESALRHHRDALDAWLDEAYSDLEEKCYYGEWDASFPHWGKIESLVGSIYDTQIIQSLSPSAIDHLLFFISRNEEIGSLIAWLSLFPGKPLSWAGDLRYDDFIYLCEQSLVREDDFCDYQLAACFQKLPTLTQTDRSILNAYFIRKSNSYTRRMVLHAFSKFRLEETIGLAQRLWDTDDCEHAKLSCLYSLQPFASASELLDRFLAEYERLFPTAYADYLQPCINEFNSQRAK